MIKLKSYSQGISILLLILNILDLVKGSNLNSKFSSQGSRNEICNDNLENLFSYISLKKESSSQLSSNYKPSDQTSSSSTTIILLPQGNKSVTPHFTITPLSSTIQRIDSDEKEIIPPIAAFADLLSFNWKYNTTIQREMERLSGIQIFIFHHSNSDSDVLAIDVNLNILLYSTQEINQPVVIMLSSFLPRKFYLSAISFLSHSHQPLHLILTHPQSEVVIIDEQLTNTDLNKLDRLFISTVDFSKDRIFLFDENMKKEEFIASVYSKIADTSIYKHGKFLGTNYNFVTKSKVLQNLWLFDNERLYSVQKPDMRIAAIYLLNKNSNFINLELGRLIKTDFTPEKDFFTNGCMNAKNLADVVTIFQKYAFDIDKGKTCFYNINSSSSSSSGLKDKYQTITWVHIESVSKIFSEIEFVSSRRLKNSINKKYLVILTGNDINDSSIKLSSLYPKAIHILTNISLSQFGSIQGPESYLISLKSIGKLNPKSLQHQEIANYLSKGSQGVMQTTSYKFISNSKVIYRIRINVDDSNSVPYNAALSRHCSYYSPTNISVSLLINANKWERIAKWMPSEFQLGDGSCIFDKNLNGTFGITRQATQCSSHFQNKKYENKIYAIWKNKKYLLNLGMGDLSCRKNYPSSKPKKKPIVTTTKLSSEDYIPKILDGIFISNKSDFRFKLVKPLQDKMVIFIQVTNNVNGAGIGLHNRIQLRDCYITNRRARINDFKTSNNDDESFKKIALVREGCFDNSSHWYSNMHRSFRPKRLYGTDSFVMYRFSVFVDSDNLASMLSLEDQYFYESQFEVHLYCGINKCHSNNQSSLLSTPPCRSQSKQCGESKIPIDSIMKYYGSLFIVKHHKHVTLKIVVLAVLVVVTILLLICFIVFFWRLKLFRSIPCHLFTVNKTLDHRQNIDFDVSFSNPHKRSANLDYHSLTLLASNHEKTSVKLYSEPKILASLKYLVENCDKSLYLDAGYLATTQARNQPQSLVTSTLKLITGKKSRIQSHSVLEISLTEPNVSNWVINSWPLSTAERKEKSQGKSNCYRQHNHQFNQQPPSNMNLHQPTRQAHSSWLPSNTHSSGSSKQKISYTFNSDLKSISNQKVSSNRTTVSESMSINEMPNKSSSSSSSKWWSLLTNYWMNQTFVISRN